MSPDRVWFGSRALAFARQEMQGGFVAAAAIWSICCHASSPNVGRPR